MISNGERRANYINQEAARCKVDAMEHGFRKPTARQKRRMRQRYWVPVKIEWRSLTGNNSPEGYRQP